MPKSKYETHVEPNLSLVEKWARDGLSHEQIAHNLSINRDTLFRYKREHSELAERLRVGRDESDAQVVNQLFQSCIGFHYKEQVMTPKCEIKEITRYAKPNVGAINFWLKNKLPEEWSDKHEIEHSGQVKNTEEHTYHVIQELVSQDENIADRLLHAFRGQRGIESQKDN